MQPVACIEYRWKQDVAGHLDDIAEGFVDLGYDVKRWTHSGSRGGTIIEPVPCETAVLWHGLHPVQNRALSIFRRCGARTFFVEYAWWDRALAFQMDSNGTNGLASWANWPSNGSECIWKMKVSKGPLLVCLQGEYDGRAGRISPWFRDNMEFIEFIHSNSRMPVVLRPHPFSRMDRLTLVAIKQLGVVLDEERPVEESIRECGALATLSSQCGVIAMEMGKPVLAYGKAAYRCPGAVFCMDDNPRTTQVVTRRLAAGICDLSPDLQRDVLDTLHQHTLYRSDLPGCLVPLLEKRCV